MMEILEMNGIMTNCNMDEICCDNRDIGVNEDGLYVCRNCGMVYGNNYVDTQKRIYNTEQYNARVQNEKWRLSFGSRTLLQVRPEDHLSSQSSTKFKYFAKINSRWSINSSLEHNLLQAKRLMVIMVDKITFPSYIDDLAW